MPRFCHACVAAVALATACTSSTSIRKTDTKPPPQPVAAAKDPQVLQFGAALGNEFVAAGTATDVVVRLRLSTRAFEVSERPPVNVVVAIDTSGSMMGAPIERARDAARKVVASLEDGDRVSIIAFHSTSEAIVPSTVLTATARPEIFARIDAIAARGTTNMQAGLTLALQEVARHRTADGINRIIVLSDGVPNNPAAIPPFIAKAKADRVPVTALGFGLEYDETLLTRIAQGTGGSFLFVERPEQVAKVLVDEVLRLEQVVASNIHLTITPGPGLSLVDVLGAPLGRSGRNGYVSLGDLSLGETRDVIVRMRASGRRDGAVVEIADAVLGFQDALGTNASFERRVFVAARATEDMSKLESGRNAEVELSAARASAAAAMVQAVAMARGGNAAAARKLLGDAEKAARADAARHAGDAKLIALADEMVKLVAALPQPVQPSVAPVAAALDMESPKPEAIKRSHRAAMRQLQGR